jgi:hypothetical protein
MTIVYKNILSYNKMAIDRFNCLKFTAHSYALMFKVTFPKVTCLDNAITLLQ